MSAHRFRALVETPALVTATSAVERSAFVSCSLTFMAPVAQHAYIQQVYELARARTQAQLQPRQRPQFTFSVN
jgi:hypothetical protein